MSKQQIRARLLDALLSDTVLPPMPNRNYVVDQGEIAVFNRSVRALLDGAVCIEASNVARFFSENYFHDEESADAFHNDLKCLVPPYPKFFVEWDRPSHIPHAKRMGILFVACNPFEAESVARAFIGPAASSTPAKIREFRNDPRCRWIYLTVDFLEFPFINDGQHISGLRGHFNTGLISVADDGSPINYWVIPASPAISQEELGLIAGSSLVGYTTLSMLNCANITTTENKVPDAFQKSRKASGKKPLVSYRTIKIDLDKTPRQVSTQSLPGEDGAKRLHKKRGHMKDYRKGKGLFGRYKGVWFWGETIAGDEEQGVVVSDYEVKP